MTELIEAIRRKFKTPQAALAALGLDTTLLDDPGDRQRKRDSKMRRHVDEMLSLLDTMGTDSDPSMRAEEETSERNGRFDPRGLGGGGEIVGGPEREGKDRRRARGRDTDPPLVHPESEQRMSAEDDEPSFEDFAEHLRRNSRMSEDDISHAIGLARDYLKRRRSNGRDRSADDRFPQRAHGSPIADPGKEARDNWGGDVPVSRPLHEGVEPPHGLDALGQDGITIRQLIARIQHEPETRPGHMIRGDRRSRKQAADSAPTEARMQKIHSRYPGLARIGSM